MYLDSSGKVTIPTIANVETKAATWEYPAPFISNVLPNENATKVGIIVIEPITAENITPNTPELSPIKWEIVSASKKDSSIPTIIIIDRNWGIIFSNDFKPVIIAVFVFFLSLKKEIIRKIIAIEYKILDVI